MTADIVDRTTRSRMMRAVGQRDTPLEIRVRQLLRGVGLRYRIHNRDLPGSPDIANRKRRWAVFVNGCFWHGHKNCRKTKGGPAGRIPRSNNHFWEEKLAQNRSRDARKIRELRGLGFKVLIVWECDLREPDVVAHRLSQCLGYDSVSAHELTRNVS